MSQPEPTSNLPMSVEYARDLVKRKSFPYIDSHGQVYLHTTTKKDDRGYLQGRDLAEHIDRYFPNFHVHTVTSPYQRATKFKPDASQRTVTGSCPSWTRDSAKKAAREFELPRDTKIIIFWPDLLQRQILQKYPNFRTETGGVLTRVIDPTPP
jgi:hypothetical protein